MEDRIMMSADWVKHHMGLTKTTDFFIFTKFRVDMCLNQNFTEKLE